MTEGKGDMMALAERSVAHIIADLEKRTVRRLPRDWKNGRVCPECGSDATRPKCFHDLGPSCPRHDPDEYTPSAYETVPDKLCAEAASALRALTNEGASSDDRG